MLKKHEDFLCLKFWTGWLENLGGLSPIIQPVDNVDYSLVDRTLILKEASDIKHPALLSYLQFRCIPANIAKLHLKQIRVKNNLTGKSFLSLSIRGKHPFFKKHPRSYWYLKTLELIRDFSDLTDKHFTMVLLKSLLFFTIAGLCEIGGGYMIWLWLKNEKPLWFGIVGAVILALYGVVATLQSSNFGRVYAAYGGIFIVLALLWGWKVDGLKLDRYDIIGASIALIGAGIIIYMPRK